jgi:hypothetical protein
VIRRDSSSPTAPGAFRPAFQPTTCVDLVASFFAVATTDRVCATGTLPDGHAGMTSMATTNKTTTFDRLPRLIMVLFSDDPRHVQPA